MRLPASALLATTCLVLCASTAAAQPGLTPPQPLYQPASPRAESVVETTSYRATTLTVDGISLGLVVAGAMSEGEGGRDSSMTEGLFSAGMLGLTFGAPLVHALRGHSGRAVGSLVMRMGLASMGVLVAMSANSGCYEPPTEDVLIDLGGLCTLEYIGYGYFAGTLLAVAIDAATMTSETREVATWTPQLAVSPEGVRAGVAWAF